ncbi:hypothetical protein GOHSU_04_00200 [Gordonia hirsuta DSM 44140 = NBRC 16056]|uniref:DoxX family protein n=1 Tax=Gordonia hirsuta DSM 44140 = NBRC 16056 TaxID=1121927 RepID=L7L5X4_9ACTN|nr:DoxX family protein [Gordonia hirsuta]GAC56151.1 hypothetical protein GOHSU_04_00200 [Gordonia hirsuta DSM 44140 = NBRC 16056]
MSSPDDARAPRRPQPDRDSFYDKHARNPAPVVTGPGDDTELPETVILDTGDDTLPTVEINRVDSAPVTRTDVRTESTAVVTEPFTDTDDDVTDADEAARRRRIAEHLTADPLPYIEPQSTAPLPAADDVEPIVADSSYDIADTPVAAPAGPVEVSDGPGRRGTADLGLLVLRVVVGILFVMHGLQKLTQWSWVDGMGVDGFAGFLANNAAEQDATLGFSADATHALAIAGGFTETIAGVFLILGLLTPIAAAAGLGVMIVAITYRVTLAGGFSFFAGSGGLEYEYLIAAACIAIILTGAGLYSLDRRWGWSWRPAWGSAAWLIIAIAAAVAIWVVFNGANPLAGH